MAAIAIALLAGGYMTYSPRTAIDSYGAETAAIVTAKEKVSVAAGRHVSGTPRTPTSRSMVSYVYSTPGGPSIRSSSAIRPSAWAELQPGDTVDIRYAVEDPSRHHIYLDGDSTDAETMLTLGWITLVIALIWLFFNIRRAIPQAVSQIGATTCLLFYVGAISVAGGALLRWDSLKGADDFVLADGSIVAKPLNHQANAGLDSGQPQPAAPKWITYRFSTNAGAQQHTRLVSQTFDEAHDKGSRIIVIYRAHNSQEHHIRSGRSLDAAEGWYIIGWIFWAIALIMFLWRVFSARTARPATSRRT